MFRQILHKLLRHRHFWRDASFNELNELYVSMLFRSLALSLTGIFVPIFLLKNSYSLSQILGFFALLFMFRAILDIAAGFLVARVGPKHSMIVSYCCQIITALLFLTLPDYRWPLLLPAIFWGAANSIFFIAFHVDFSKVKHQEHGGKELGYIQVMEKLGGMVGPLLGGIISIVFGAQYIFLAAAGLLFTGLAPLFRTAEPVRTHQKLDFKGFILKPHKRDLLSYSAVLVENNLTLILWPLFLGLFVLSGQVYLVFGILSSVSIFAAALAAYGIGKLVDEKKGGQLLRIGTIINALIHGLRGFIGTIISAGILGVANDVVTLAYRIPYHKGFYDAADSLPGHRIVYIVTMEAVGSFCKMLVWLELLILSSVLSNRHVLLVGFLIAAVASLLIMTQRFKSLEYAKSNE